MVGYDVSSVHDASTPSVSEFLAHPDHRQIVSFFLGWVFICSTLCIVTSPVMRRLHRRRSRVFGLGGLMQLGTGFHNENGAPWNNVEKSVETFLADDQGSSLTSPEDENSALALILFVCFAFASIAHFSSLLSFHSNSGPSACAFVVAWGGISATCGRFLGLIILNLDLRKFALWRWEVYLAWSWLVICGAFVFATYATSIGAISYVPQLETYFCYRTIYLPTALTMSVMFISLELYIIGRLLSLIAPPFLELKHRIGAVTDTRVLRALSLLLLELFLLVPGVKFIGIVGEFVPFSIGALIVLAMFHKHRTRPILGEPMPIPPMSLPGSRAPTIRFSILPRMSTQSHIRHISAASSTSFSGYSFNTTSPSFQTEVINIVSKARYTQSRPQLLDPSGNIVSLVSSHGHGGAIEEHPRTYSEPPPFIGRILPKQVEFSNSLEAFQDPSSRWGLPIRPRIKITTSQPTQQHVEKSQPRSADSVAYGSDIIRPSATSRSKVDVTKRPPWRSGSTLPSDASFLSPLESTSSCVVHRRTKRDRRSAPVTPSDECLVVRPDGWSTLGHCSLSPTMRRTFGDQSLRSFVPQTSTVTEQSVASVRRSPILLKRSTFGEQSFSVQNLTASQRLIRKIPSLTLGKKAVEDDNLVDPFISGFLPSSPVPPAASGVRIRGPRPPPRVFSPSNTTPTAGSFGVVDISKVDDIRIADSTYWS